MGRFLLVFFTALALFAGSALSAAKSSSDDEGVRLQSAPLNTYGDFQRKSLVTVDQPPAAFRTTRTDFDYSVNLKSNVFGAKIFSGSFAQQGASQFNPNYLVAVGDRIQVRMWGGFDLDAILTVDPKGNIFIPHLGPVGVLGVKNGDLQGVVESAIRTVYRANVFCYASLASAQPVRIFVSGFVNRPGLYSGTSLDSLLYYLDQAGGIDSLRGSFLDVKVIRDGQVRAEVNLYDFIFLGLVKQVQLNDGDVILVNPLKFTISVKGLVDNANKFEFATREVKASDLAKMARNSSSATHIRVMRNSVSSKNVDYYPVSALETVTLLDGDEVEFIEDKQVGTITVRVEGEHLSPREYVLPHGAHFGDVMKYVNFTDNSDKDSVQLFRVSVRERQRELLKTAIQNLERSALTASSQTAEEATLRKTEADLLLQWAERAKKIEPTGQVIIAKAGNSDSLLMENGDIINIPAKSGLVTVSGEVLFPTAISYNKNYKTFDYVSRAGGFTQNADDAKIVIAHLDGSSEDYFEKKEGFFSPTVTTNEIKDGDKILVLPKITLKSAQVAKDLTQILFQMAMTAKVVMGF